MANLFASRAGENAIFRDEGALLPDYLPEVLPHRERELKELVDALQGFARGRKGENALLVGPTGTGKTSAARFVLKQLQEFTSKVVCVYDNCWQTSTRHGILSSIALALELAVPRRGVSSDEIMSSVVEAVKQGGKNVIVVLDEVDRLFAVKGEEWEVLYDLLRAGEMHGIHFGLIGITNSEELLASIDARIRSSLAQKQIQFKQYSPQQLKDILKERAKIAFVQDALDDEVIPLCAAIGAKRGGDARVAISVLWKAGRQAERENARKVSLEHVKKVKMDEYEVIEAKLNEIEKKIVAAVRKKGELTSGELYKMLGEAERTIGTYVNNLEKLGILETKLLEKKEEKGGVLGKTKLIWLKKR